MSVTFCGVCRHETPGHEPNCPVYTQEPVRGYQGLSQRDMQAMGQQQQSMAGAMSYVCPHCGGLNGVHVRAGQGVCPGSSTHWSQYGQIHQQPYGQSDTDTRILTELATVRDQLLILTHLVHELCKNQQKT